MIGPLSAHWGRAMAGDEALREERARRAPSGNLRRTAEDGVVIEEFDSDTAPTLAEILKRRE